MRVWTSRRPPSRVERRQGREIREHCEKIADGPHYYVTRPDLRGTIPICAHGNYLIVFEPFGAGALILRVLHGARNLPAVLGGN